MGKFLDIIKKNSLPILALVVSVFTLFIYVRQTNILVQQTKASSWPYLMVSRNLYQGISAKTNSVAIDTLEIYVANKGTEPAIIEAVVVRLNGEELKEWRDLYKVVSVPDSIEISHNISSIHEEVIMPGEKIVLINWNGNHVLANYLFDKLKDMEIAICYKSIHEDYWTISRENFVNLGDISRAQSKGCQLKAKTYFM